MTIHICYSRRTRATLALTFTFATLALFYILSTTLHTASASGGGSLQLSTDPYTNSTRQHKTEVEPDTYSFNSTIVSAFQVGRFTNGGGSNTGWATSTDNGTTWANGFLPGTTVYATPAGTYARISDPSVTYDARHKTWMIAGLAILNEGGTPTGAAVLVSRSIDGGLTWSNPVTVAKAATGAFFDKDWIACDNTTTSPFYGHCYVEWDLATSGDRVFMSTSTNGGLKWRKGLNTVNHASGLGGQPLVQPNGTVVVPFFDGSANILAFTSTNGGTSWNKSVTVSAEINHVVAGNLRSEPLPSAEIDGAGKIYLVWQDCRFETGCAANDIVLSTSTDGTTWSAVQRIPIDTPKSGVDHFIPGIGGDKTTSGSTAHIGLAYYYYSNANCTTTTCQLNVGFVSSTNGGSSWSVPSTLSPSPMKVTWLANTTLGYMVGDYISTSFANVTAYPVFTYATAPIGVPFNQSEYTFTSLPLSGGTHTATADHVVVPSGHRTAPVLTAY